MERMEVKCVDDVKNYREEKIYDMIPVGTSNACIQIIVCLIPKHLYLQIYLCIASNLLEGQTRFVMNYAEGNQNGNYQE